MSSKTGFDKFLENQMSNAIFAANFVKTKSEIDTIDKLRNQIPGLIYVPDWIDSELESSLLKKKSRGNLGIIFTEAGSTIWSTI